MIIFMILLGLCAILWMVIISSFCLWIVCHLIELLIDLVRWCIRPRTRARA